MRIVSSFSSWAGGLRLRMGSLMVLAGLATVGAYAIVDSQASSGGITGYTEKSTSSGCYCHCGSQQTSTTVTLATTSGTSPLSAGPNTAYTFTVNVANSGESYAGVDVASYSGNGLSVSTGSGLQLSNGEVTHTSPQAFSGGSTTWTFTYTTGSTAGWDTLYATGNAVNHDGQNGAGNCSDKWNWSNKFIIHIIAPTKRMALSTTSISMGNVRVNKRKAAAVTLTSNGDQPISINSSQMKTGAVFSNSPTTANRQLTLTETDSVIFVPTARGGYNDSLIFTTNSDTIPQQRMGLAVSGTGVAPVFSASNGTTLNFGNLRPSRTSQLTFSYSNTGDDTLFLAATPASISGSGFTIASGPTHTNYLLPSQSDAITVQFAPQTKQSYSGTLTISASDGTTIPTVSLSGNGVLPQIQFTSLQSVGVAKVGLSTQGTVSYKNVGNDTLHIVAASLTQLTNKFTLGAYDAMVLPGATGTAHLTYAPSAEMLDTATLHLTTDDPASTFSNISLNASGVLPHMSLADKTPVDLGQVRVGDTVSRDFAINNTGGADLSISSALVGGAPFIVKTRPTYIAAGTTGYVTVLFVPTSSGTFNDSLTVSSDDAANPVGKVMLSAAGINSALSISPGNLDFGAVPVSSTVVDTIVLTNSGSASVTVTHYALTASTGGFSIIDSSVHTISSSGPVMVRVSFHPTAATSYTGSITISSNDNSAPTRVVNLSGRGVQGALAVTPSTVDFGTIKSGTDSTIAVSLKNTGAASVNLSTATIYGADASSFSTTGFTSGPLAAGASQNINVKFSPSSPGTAYNASLTITSSDGATSVSIPLTGRSQVQQGGGVRDIIASAGFSVVLAPNPAADFTTVNIHSSDTRTVDVRVFDATGREVLMAPVGMISAGESATQLMTKGLANGTYFVRVADGTGNIVESRLVIER